MASTIKVDKIAQASGTPAFTIPTADGAANTFLKTDGSGVLSFSAVTTTALTGSTNTWIPTITGANALTGTANFTYDGNVLDVKNSGTASSINLYCETGNAHYIKIKSGPHASATSYTLTLPNAPPSVSGQVLSATTAGVASWAAAGGGKVLQVVEGTTISTTYVTSTTYIDIGMYISITPSATTSKIYVSAVWGATQDGGSNHYSYAQLNREESGESDVGMAGHVVWYDTAGGDTGVSQVLQKLDAPATTAALTYQVQAKVQNASSGYRPKAGGASIVAMEIGV